MTFVALHQDSFSISHIQKKKKRDDGTAASVFKDKYVNS